MPGLTVTPQHELKVGSADKNLVSFEITATEAAEFFASIDIPCGKATSNVTYLCGDAQLAQLYFLSDPSDKITGSVTRQSANVAWQSDQFSLQAGEKVKIKITGFNPEGGGNASLNLKIWSDPDEPALFNQATTVSVSTPPGVAIIYFDVSPTNVLQGERVTISCATIGAKIVKLYAGDTEVQDLKRSETNETSTVSEYAHSPQETTTYRLKAWQDKSGGNERVDEQLGLFAQRELGAVVQPRPHWYSRDLLINSLRGARAGQSFYPTLLLAAKDLSGNTSGDRLYGIFVRKGTKDAGLWSSSSGFDGWRWEADVPEGMGESPGVIHKQALWLIGGSSADPLGPVSNRVWWYYKDKNNRMVWEEWDKDGSKRKAANVPAPRRCHACAVFNDRVWVLGGLSEQNKTLADVWTCTADPANGDFTAAWSPSQPLPSGGRPSAGRCLSAVAATPTATKMGGIGQPRLWLYGGATHPYNLNETFDELWWTQDGKTWEPLRLPPGEKKQTLGATLLYDGGDKLLHLAGVFRDSGGGVLTSDHKLTDVNVEPPAWGKGSLNEFGWDFKLDLFLIRSVSFGRRWIFWPVYQDWAEMEKYWPRIYNTP
jgi:hypothetical protein